MSVCDGGMFTIEHVFLLWLLGGDLYPAILLLSDGHQAPVLKLILLPCLITLQFNLQPPARLSVLRPNQVVKYETLICQVYGAFKRISLTGIKS